MTLILLVGELQCCVLCSLHPWQNSDQRPVFSLQSSCSSRGVDSLWRRSPHCIRLDFICIQELEMGSDTTDKDGAQIPFAVHQIQIATGFHFQFGPLLCSPSPNSWHKNLHFPVFLSRDAHLPTHFFHASKIRCLRDCGVFISKDLFTQLSCSASQNEGQKSWISPLIHPKWCKRQILKYPSILIVTAAYS